MLKIITILISLCLTVGCSSMFINVDGFNCRKLLKTIPNEKGGLDVNKFRALNDNEEYAFFMCEQIYYTPSLDRLGYYYAQEGEKIVPLLMNRLSNTNEELIIYNILEVFAEMQRQKIFDVSRREDVLKLLEEKILVMPDYPPAEYRSYKELALSTLKEIRYQLPFDRN